MARVDKLQKEIIEASRDLHRKKISYTLTKEEELQAACNHMYVDNDGESTDALVDNGDGTYTCKICGSRFSSLPLGISKNELKRNVNKIVSALQYIKMIYPNLDPQVRKEYFKIIPLLERVPDIYEDAENKAEEFSEKEKKYNFEDLYTPRNLNILMITKE